ncbi:MAG: bifunctional diaminohydroxyphosphoribosylaminopyrimidine deaminase/5-amino-6-(5-phosphoribosylamino)uracil reductase RibD [Thermodesulfobacteriota bacterium]|nr:bifunctional diaminohydroxyphosphoribosylaminopyrimidine deaminase/5-amino-6-(5-phosphoribosylamino)uracil reductase RibD [Thermodesulfobacteriota bacterium]
MSDIDIKFMREALRQARKGLGRTSPNPAVGAVIVRNGVVIGTGYHHRAGMPHAEAEVLTKLGGNVREDDTLYVTLEPCNHYGRTPPCTEAILQSGLKRVVVGMKDPNPVVSGGGCDFLRRHGVEVRTGVLEAECLRLNEAFIKFVTSRRPFVIIKSALTLDGWTATGTGDSKWITNEKSRQFVHVLRGRTDAVMVGVGTIIADDPYLNTRLKRGRGKDPLRIIVDTHLRTPPQARILHNESSADTLIAIGPDVSPEQISKFQENRVSILACSIRDGRIDLNALMDTLGEMSITSVLVEGGAGIIGTMLRERLADKFYVFRSPKILGGNDGVPMATGPGAGKMDRCITLNPIQIKRFGEDILTVGYPEYSSLSCEASS